jgi:hypothetical protein
MPTSNSLSEDKATECEAYNSLPPVANVYKTQNVTLVPLYTCDIVFVLHTDTNISAVS